MRSTEVESPMWATDRHEVRNAVVCALAGFEWVGGFLVRCGWLPADLAGCPTRCLDAFGDGLGAGTVTLGLAAAGPDLVIWAAETASVATATTPPVMATPAATASVIRPGLGRRRYLAR